MRPAEPRVSGCKTKRIARPFEQIFSPYAHNARRCIENRLNATRKMGVSAACSFLLVERAMHCAGFATCRPQIARSGRGFPAMEPGQSRDSRQSQ